MESLQVVEGAGGGLNHFVIPVWPVDMTSNSNPSVMFKKAGRSFSLDSHYPWNEFQCPTRGITGADCQALTKHFARTQALKTDTVSKQIRIFLYIEDWIIPIVLLVFTDSMWRNSNGVNSGELVLYLNTEQWVRS